MHEYDDLHILKELSSTSRHLRLYAATIEKEKCKSIAREIRSRVRRVDVSRDVCWLQKEVTKFWRIVVHFARQKGFICDSDRDGEAVI
jgi:hypothetical protein